MSYLTMSRRRLLKHLGLAAVAATPVFRRGIRSAEAQDVVPQRFLSVYHPAGWRVVPRTHWYYTAQQEISDSYLFPGKRRNASYSLDSVTDAWPEETQPLERVKDHLVFVEGLHNYANRGPNNHMAGVQTLLTGSDPLKSFQAHGGTSLDYFLMRKQPTKFSGINLSIGVKSNLSSSGAYQPIWSEHDPLKAYQLYFAELVDGEDAEARRAELVRRRIMRRSVLDHSSGEIRASLPLIPQHERPKLEAHLESIRSMELRLDALPSSAAICQVPGAPMIALSNDAIPDITEAMFDILVAALACDLARSATFAFGRGTLAFTPTFLGVNEHYHALSHYGLADEAKQRDYTALLRWTSDKVASLIERLDAIPESDGKSLLHHSLMLWSTDNSNGWNHNVDDVPFVLAGQASGALDTGRVVSFPYGTRHNRLLVSAAQAFGEPIDAYGPAEYCVGGALPGLFS